MDGVTGTMLLLDELWTVSSNIYRIVPRLLIVETELVELTEEEDVC